MIYSKFLDESQKLSATTPIWACQARRASHVAVGLYVLLSMCACSVAPTASGQAKAAVAPSLSQERIAQIVGSADRSAADQVNDQRRKPEQMLAFIGIRPGMTALDLSAGGGYTTELLARSVGVSGRAFGQSQPPRADAHPAFFRGEPLMAAEQRGRTTARSALAGMCRLKSKKL